MRRWRPANLILALEGPLPKLKELNRISFEHATEVRISKRPLSVYARGENTTIVVNFLHVPMSCFAPIINKFYGDTAEKMLRPCNCMIDILSMPCFINWPFPQMPVLDQGAHSGPRHFSCKFPYEVALVKS